MIETCVWYQYVPLELRELNISLLFKLSFDPHSGLLSEPGSKDTFKMRFKGTYEIKKKKKNVENVCRKDHSST